MERQRRRIEAPPRSGRSPFPTQRRRMEEQRLLIALRLTAMGQERALGVVDEGVTGGVQVAEGRVRRSESNMGLQALSAENFR